MHSPSEISSWAEGQKRQKFTWLEQHGPGSKRPWPDHVCDAKRRDIAMLDAVIEICANLQGSAAA